MNKELEDMKENLKDRNDAQTEAQSKHSSHGIEVT